MRILSYTAGVLLAALIAPISGCADRATVPTSPSAPAVQATRDPATLTLVDLGTLGTSFICCSSEARGINASGDVVGWSTDPRETQYDFKHAVLWRDGQKIEIGTFGGHTSRAWAINDDGIVVGGAFITGDYVYHPFAWQDGVMTDLGSLGVPQTFEIFNSIAYGINNSGQIVGVSDNNAHVSRAVLWDDGAIIDLGTLGGATSVAYAINPSGTIVGSSLTASGETHAFRWQNGEMTDLGTLGGTRSVAYAINPAGDIVGSSTTAGGEEHAVLWRKGDDIADLGTNGSSSVARGISPSRQIVGYVGSPGSMDAFLWQKGEMTVLPGALLEVTGEPPARGNAHAYAINPAGEIAGDGRTPFSLGRAALWTWR